MIAEGERKKSGAKPTSTADVKKCKENIGNSLTVKLRSGQVLTGTIWKVSHREDYHKTPLLHLKQWDVCLAPRNRNSMGFVRKIPFKMVLEFHYGDDA